MNKPVNCGCGGEAKVIMLIPEVYAVECSKCWIRTGSPAKTEAEAVAAWDRAMGERTAKVRDKKDESMIDEWHHGRCMNCGKQVRRRDNYCSRCGVRLEWNE